VGAGMTEWITDSHWQEIREYVLLICKDNGIDIVDHGPGPWNPVRMQAEL
jgi:acetone carboxylase gamma subunit